MAEETLGSGSLEQLVRALKNARVERNLSIDEIGRLVKMPSTHIERLEEGDFSFLPPLYVFSFIRKYAAELGIGDEAMFRQCREELGIPGAKFSTKPSASVTPELPDTSRPAIGGKGRKVMVIATVAAIVIIGTILYFFARH
ncbi:MAG: helix-turn-helix domain-containing protein [Chlorobiaceae bacterium]|nr:helix-turn-helix domain-containing protein [Chlorobiaceae bacterium]